MVFLSSITLPNGQNIKSICVGMLIESVEIVLCGGCISTTDPLANAPKAITDSDFNTMGDDGPLFAMTTQLMR